MQPPNLISANIKVQPDLVQIANLVIANISGHTVYPVLYVLKFPGMKLAQNDNIHSFYFHGSLSYLYPALIDVSFVCG